MIKAEHAGDTCSAFSDVVNFVVGRTQDFAGSAVVVVNAKIIGRFSPFLMSAIGH
ncbi:hypothetical protein [Escherichia coli]|nr:hypothetical protein [Escherichia coli]